MSALDDRQPPGGGPEAEARFEERGAHLADDPPFEGLLDLLLAHAARSDVSGDRLAEAEHDEGAVRHERAGEARDVRGALFAREGVKEPAVDRAVEGSAEPLEVERVFADEGRAGFEAAIDRLLARDGEGVLDAIDADDPMSARGEEE